MARGTYCLRGRALVWIIVLSVVGMVFAVVFGLITCQMDYWLIAYDPQTSGQLHSIEVGIDMFIAELGREYPPSDDYLLTGKPGEDLVVYGGAQKLSEAMMGWDLRGFHSDSDFTSDGCTVDASGAIKQIYANSPENQKARKRPFMEPENANAIRLGDIYETSVLMAAGIDEDNYVLCDSFLRKRPSGKKTGMPILYYKADMSKSGHDISDLDSPGNIYNYKDNHALLSLGVPGEPKKDHPMFADPTLFYEMTKNDQIITISRPYRAGSYILWSAGKDGLYGTKDDIKNFQQQ